MPDEKAPLTGPAATETAATAAKSEISQDAPFFEDVLPNGEKKVFQTRDEFVKEWQRQRMYQADYTRKTQEVAQTRKQYEDQQKKFEDERKQFVEMKRRYDTWDEKLRMRPDVQRQLEQYLEQPENPANAFERARGYVDETAKTLQEKVDAIEKQLSEANSKREIQEAFAGVKAKFPDADEAVLMEMLENISDGSVPKLLESLYYARKGQTSPAEVEQKVVENLQKKEAARMVPPTAGHKSAPPKFKNLDEARSAAYKEMGLPTGG